MSDRSYSKQANSQISNPKSIYMPAGSPMRNSDAFLAIFSEVEKWLRTSAGNDRRTTFHEALQLVADKNPLVRRFKDDLKEFADLRNAIVHERSDGHVIAEPNDRALTEFRQIQASLLRPPKVIPQFQRTVKYRMAHEAVGLAVQDMREGSFSQLPVLHEGKIIALLTSETVVRWLASELKNDLVSLGDTAIAEVLGHVEDEEHYCYLSRDASLHDAVVRFEDFAARGKDLDAILITDRGSSDQKLLGILTVSDLPAILRNLGLRRIATS